MTDREFLKQVLIPAFLQADLVSIEEKMEVVFLLGWLSAMPIGVADHKVTADGLIASVIGNLPKTVLH